MSLTEAGHAYFARSSAIITDIEELQDSVRHLHRQPTGVLRVTSSVTFGPCSLAPLIGGFLDEYPDISVQLDLTNRFVDIVEEGFDLAIRVGSPQSSSLISRPLMDAIYPHRHHLPAKVRVLIDYLVAALGKDQ